MGSKADKMTIDAYEKEFDRGIPLGQTAKNPSRIAASLYDSYVNAGGFE